MDIITIISGFIIISIIMVSIFILIITIIIITIIFFIFISKPSSNKEASTKLFLYLNDYQFLSDFLFYFSQNLP